MSRDIPILFSAPMVRANLAGTKTQTRRVLKQATGPSLSVGYEDGMAELSWLHGDGPGHEVHETIKRVPCPYGQPGDRLWVRETWRKACAHEDDDTLCIAYRASQEEGRGGLIVNNIPRPADVERWETEDDVWRPSIFMPRWASRTTLLVKEVRIERLQAISDEDAIAEGIERDVSPNCWRRGPIAGDQNLVDITAFPRLAYQSLWESINGADSWKANPWVWVITYERIKP